jgi:hypothetical protein
MKIKTRTLVFIIFACLGLRGNSLEAASPDANLQKAADDAYERILAIFEEVPPDKCNPVDSNEIECNYWHLGNAFDTAIDYLIMNRSKAEAFAKAVINKYDLTSKTPWVCWYDDFGWWAVAAQRALEQHGLWSKEQIRRFEEIAVETWTKMQPGLSVWDLDQENFSSLKPYFDGGIWNYFWTTQKLSGVCQTPCTPPDLSDNSFFCGRQNTVTNGLYLVAATMRAGDTGDLYYVEAATREWDFLRNWFNFPGDSDNSLLYRLDSAEDGPAVIRERVSTYANNDEDPKFSPDLIWAGDQGLILGGLLRFIDAVPTDPDDRQAKLNVAKRITDGVLEYLSDGARFFPWSNVKNPSPDTIGGSPDGDDSDYNAGIGVYMRYLLYAYQTNKEMRQHLQDTGYPELIRQFAEDYAAQDKGLCYPIPAPGEAEHCDELVRNTNKLAALVAALDMK